MAAVKRAKKKATPSRKRTGTAKPRPRARRDSSPVRIDFTLKSSGTSFVQVDVDSDVIQFTNGKGFANLSRGKHDLGWNFTGNAGASLEIEGKEGSSSVVKEKDKIPAGEISGFGTSEFEV